MQTQTFSHGGRRPARPQPRKIGSARRLQGLGRLLSGWHRAVQIRRQQQRDIAHLSQLPDYLLKDIGLTRETINGLRARRPDPALRRLDEYR